MSNGQRIFNLCYINKNRGKAQVRRGQGYCRKYVR